MNIFNRIDMRIEGQMGKEMTGHNISGLDESLAYCLTSLHSISTTALIIIYRYIFM